MTSNLPRVLCMHFIVAPLIGACADDPNAAAISYGPSGWGGSDDDSPTPGSEEDSGDDSGDSSDSDPSSGASECVAGQEQCKADEHTRCVDGRWASEPCPADGYCDEQSDRCLACACSPGQLGACTAGGLEVCREDCSGFDVRPCEGGACLDGACVDLVCSPGLAACDELDRVHTCDQTGTAWALAHACATGERCLDGACVSACEAAAATRSNLGCEFWAVDMANLPPRHEYTYALSVSNPSFELAAMVQVYDKRSGTETLLVTASIAPRSVEIIPLSGAHAGYTSVYAGQDAGLLGSGIGLGTGFRLVSDRPVLATQFNPIGGASGYTTDASLLLPTHTLGREYIDLDWGRGYGAGATLDVVATADATTLTITPTADIAAGTHGLPAMTAGVPTELTLDAYDYVQLTVAQLGLTGSTIVADRPVAVFGGHTCASVPDRTVGACDHVEEQLFPLDTWGTRYVAARTPQRVAEPMRWRILASEDNTTVRFDPPVSVGAELVLDAREWVEFDEQQDFYISADDPILVAGYIHGAAAGGGQGDPSMVLMVPVEQYRDDYVFLVDASYTRSFVKLIRPTGAAVELECLGLVPDALWSPVGASGWEQATVTITSQPGNPGPQCRPGTNAASSKSPFGIIVSGEASYASYAYPGGLGLARINPQ
jgi:hypothetical protein